MSRIQRIQSKKRNWREAKTDQYDEKRIKLPKIRNRREEFQQYLQEFGNYDDIQQYVCEDGEGDIESIGIEHQLGNGDDGDPLDD